MVSGKFFRRPERGALGNGLRIIVGTIAATSGTIEITTRGRRLLLHPRKAGYTQISATSAADYPIGTRLVVTFGPDLPEDENALFWAHSAIAIAQATRQPYSRPTSPHWIDADNMAQILETIEPTTTTVRSLVERLDGCSGAKAGKIAAPFGKGMLCRDMSEQQAGELVTATQAVTRKIKPDALIRLGPDIFGEEYNGYDCECGSVFTGLHAPYADIPFLVEAWVSVTDKTGFHTDLKVYANRTPVAADPTADRSDDGVIHISNLNIYHNEEIGVKRGRCSIIIHVTSPRIPILSTGKRPDFSEFGPQLNKAVRLAFNRSHRLAPDDPSDAKKPKQQKPVKPPRPIKLVHVPTTTLGILIANEARAHGVSQDALTVLTVGNDPCRFDNARAVRDGRWFADLVDKHVPEHLKAHVRGLYYKSVGNLHRPDTGKLLVNSKANWEWFKKASLAARWLAFVGFDKIRDGRNDPSLIPSFL
jgi:hypothetical protein